MKLIFALVFITSIIILNSWNVSASSYFDILDYEEWNVSILSYFNVLNYGAVGDGKTDDSQAFLTAWKKVCGAIERIPVLYVPIGKTFVLNPLTFQGPCKSTYIYFNLKGNLLAPSKDKWPSVDKDKWVQFLDVHGLTLKGTGQFDGQGSLWWKNCRQTDCIRPMALFFHNCNRLQVKKTKHFNSAKNHMSINFCNNVSISDIHIIAPYDSPNTDGIDISRSSHVLIQNSSMATGDDCIAINNGSSNINIIGVTCGPGHGISIGSLGKDGEYDVVENIFVSDCIFQDTQNGVRIKTWEGGHGYAKNITFEKITLINANNPIIIDQYYPSLPHSRKNKAMDIKVCDVTYRDIHGTSANENAIVLKCSQARCTNIIMDNINIKTSTPTKKAISFCQNVDGKSKSIVVPKVSCLTQSQYVS